MKLYEIAEPKGIDSLKLTERPTPKPGPGEVLVRSRAVGICHSDLELLAGRYIIPIRYPITPGREWAGEVAETGPGVEGLTPGDRVVGECVVGPGGRDHFGFSIPGAAAEYFLTGEVFGAARAASRVSHTRPPSPPAAPPRRPAACGPASSSPPTSTPTSISCSMPPWRWPISARARSMTPKTCCGKASRPTRPRSYPRPQHRAT